VKNGVLTNAAGQPLEFEILLVSPSFERVMAPYVKNLKKIGVRASYRRIDPALYMDRIKNFDFDMVVNVFAQSLSPGNEQRGYWHSSSRDRKGSRNLAGVADPVVDALVDQNHLRRDPGGTYCRVQRPLTGYSGMGTTWYLTGTWQGIDRYATFFRPAQNIAPVLRSLWPVSDLVAGGRGAQVSQRFTLQSLEDTRRLGPDLGRMGRQGTDLLYGDLGLEEHLNQAWPGGWNCPGRVLLFNPGPRVLPLVGGVSQGGWALFTLGVGTRVGRGLLGGGPGLRGALPQRGPGGGGAHG